MQFYSETANIPVQENYRSNLHQFPFKKIYFSVQIICLETLDLTPDQLENFLAT
jgi:hypothetical protein